MAVTAAAAAKGACLAAVLGTGCAGAAPAPTTSPRVEAERTPVAVQLPVPPAAKPQAATDPDPQEPDPSEPDREDRDRPAEAPPSLDPQLLVPTTAEDEVVVRVGKRVLRKSHVFDRLAVIRPRLAMQVVDLLVLDLLVAEHAIAHDIQVDAAEVDELVSREVDLLRRGIASQLGGDVTLETYVRTNFAMDLAEFRQLLRLRIAQRFYHDYVIRFMALREPRVRVRFIVNRDRALMQEIARKVREGADFGSLALQHSEDESRRDNGLLPPFGPSFDHPVAAAAFALEVGEVSPLFTADAADGPRHYLVYCLEELPGRPEVTFAEVRDEIREGLREAPRTDFEDRAYVRRHSDRMERMGGVEFQPRSVLNSGASRR